MKKFLNTINNLFTKKNSETNTLQNKQFVTYSNLHSSQSAIKSFTVGQKLTAFLIIFIIAEAIFLNPLLAIQIGIALLSFIYLVDIIFNSIIVLKSLHTTKEITFTQKELDEIDEKSLPSYTILCPLYKEVGILPQFIEAMSNLDYPKEKLQIILIFEEDDTESLKKINKFLVPKFFKGAVVPLSLPRTKPKACNYGLSYATGEYVVIYDAEDVPDPLQLKKAFLGFQKVDENIICLQAKLNYYNPNQNLLTRLFTAEYSLWFNIILPGLHSLNSIIPLGGTSNHFKTSRLKELEGWDAFNVTEDADLGIRLFKKGYKTAIIDSLTLEEANSNIAGWVRQRSRWIKGYMQTYLVHTRNGFSFGQTKRIHKFIFHLLMGGKIAFVLINPILWLTTIAYFTLNSIVGSQIQMLYPAPVLYLALPSLVIGNFLFLYFYMLGCAKNEQWWLIKYIIFAPFYWLMMSLAASISIFQLFFKPHFWEKTNHGLHIKSKPRVLDAILAKIIKNNIRSLLGIFEEPKLNKNSATEKLRILIFNWRDTKHKYAGGAEVYIQELAKRWVKNGNQVTIFCGNDNRNLVNDTIDGIEIIRRGGTYTVYAFAILYYFVKFRGKYDVIIDSENGIPFFTPLYSTLPKFLLIHHVHQEVFRRHLIPPLAILAKFLESKLMPLVYRNTQIITVSESSKDEILKLGLNKTNEIKIIHPGIDNNDFFHMEKTSYPSFLYLGRLQAYKNIDIAIKAFAEVYKQFPNAIFTIAGSGEEKEKLKRLVTKLNLVNSIIFAGKVSDYMKKTLLAKSWAAIQPSMMEGFGITVIEANASGTPVIASNVNGLKDSVVDRKTGILIEAKDVNSLTEAIISIIKSQDIKEYLSTNAYNWSKNFSWDKNASEFYAEIIKLISKSIYNKNVSIQFSRNAYMNI